MLVDFPTIIYFEIENWCLVNGQLMTSYPGMELVPCEWAAGGPVILVWNWCPVNGQLVDQ